MGLPNTANPRSHRAEGCVIRGTKRPAAPSKLARLAGKKSAVPQREIVAALILTRLLAQLLEDFAEEQLDGVDGRPAVAEHAPVIAGRPRKLRPDQRDRVSAT